MPQLEFTLSLSSHFSCTFLLTTLYFGVPFPGSLGDAGEQLPCFALGLTCMSVQVLSFECLMKNCIKYF